MGSRFDRRIRSEMGQPAKGEGEFGRPGFQGVTSGEDVKIDKVSLLTEGFSTALDGVQLGDFLPETRGRVEHPSFGLLVTDAYPEAVGGRWIFGDVLGEPFIVPPAGRGLAKRGLEDLGMAERDVAGGEGAEAESADHFVCFRADCVLQDELSVVVSAEKIVLASGGVLVGDEEAVDRRNGSVFLELNEKGVNVHAVEIELGV